MILASPLSSPPYYAPYDISHDDFLISPLYIYMTLQKIFCVFQVHTDCGCRFFCKHLTTFNCTKVSLPDILPI